MVTAKMVTVMRWYVQDEANQEESEQNEGGWRNEEGSWFHMVRWCIVKERLVICNEEDTGGRAIYRVTTDEEWVLPVDWTEMRLCG